MGIPEGGTSLFLTLFLGGERSQGGFHQRGVLKGGENFLDLFGGENPI